MPNVELLLKDPYVDWYESRASGEAELVLYGRGYATINGRYLERQRLIDVVRAECCEAESGSEEALRKLIPRMDGAWALVAQWPDGRVLAAVDRLRSIPLFYSSTSTDFVLSASIDPLLERGRGRCIDMLAAFEFLLCGYATGDATIYQHVRQIRPGNTLEFDPDSTGQRVRMVPYYRFYPGAFFRETEAELKDRLATVIDNIFDAFVRDRAPGRIIVPLSGGLDSRLVVAMLKKHGVDDVLCYSYGRPGNEEATISQQVADAVGYEWRFIEYSPELWSTWMATDEMKRYMCYCSKGTSIPHFQDFPAVSAVMADHDDPEPPVFFPGYSVDMLAGSHIPSNYRDIQNGKISVPEQLLNRHYGLWPLPRRRGKSQLLRLLLEKIDTLSTPPGASRNGDPISRIEMWDLECRQALFIVNSVRVYEFFGSPWRIVWDHPLMDFFQRVPWEYRLGKSLYVGTLRDLIFTGPLAPLREIPLAGVGDWKASSVYSPTKRAMLGKGREAVKGAVRSLLRAAGILERVRNMFKKKYDNPVFFETWFARGEDVTSLTLADAFRPYRTLEKLPKELRSCVEPSLERRLDLGSHNGLLAAITLGELCAGTDFLPSK